MRTKKVVGHRLLAIAVSTLVLAGGPLAAEARTTKGKARWKSGNTTTTTTAPTTSPTTSSTNQPPVAQITSPQVVPVGTAVNIYSSTSSDPDGDPITWRWSQVGGPTVTLTSTWPAQVGFTPTEAAIYTIRVTVTDDKGASASKDTTVTAQSSSTSSTSTTSGSTTSTTAAPSGTTSTKAGESNTSTVEPRLLSDPNVLWVGTFDSSNWEQLHGASNWDSKANTAVGTFTGVPSYGNVLRMRNPAYNQKGAGFNATFTSAGFGEQEEAYLRYRVFFPSDYVWTNAGGGGSGKLPGLAGKATGEAPWAVGAGGSRWNNVTEVAKSNLDEEDGWSARMLWQKDGGLSSYLYAISPVGVSSSNSYFGYSARCKVDPFNSGSANKLFTKGAWNTVEQYVKMNTPGSNNGVLKIWMNGSLCLQMTNIQYRSAIRPNLRITQVFWSWFYGGPSSDYPDRDSSVYFDDAVISKGYIGPRQ